MKQTARERKEQAYWDKQRFLVILQQPLSLDRTHCHTDSDYISQLYQHETRKINSAHGDMKGNKLLALGLSPWRESTFPPLPLLVVTPSDSEFLNRYLYLSGKPCHEGGRAIRQKVRGPLSAGPGRLTCGLLSERVMESFLSCLNHFQCLNQNPH